MLKTEKDTIRTDRISLVAELDLILMNPTSGKVPYSARSRIIGSLINELLVAMHNRKDNINGRPALELLRSYAFGDIE